MTRVRRSVACLGLAVACLPAGVRADEFEFFEQHIRPVLVERCYKCHSAASEKLKGELLLDTRAGLLKGGTSGRPAIVPGDPEKSLLLEAIRYQNADLQMPPKTPLTDAQIARFVAWVEQGAPDPRVAPANPDPAKAERARAHWAFQPPRATSLPPVRHARWTQSPVDRFILARLEAQGLAPARPADRHTLLRRVTYDLTGLPPTDAEVRAFTRDSSPDAFAKVVDRLLASPRYGERWGRHWLDVARYSDTKGYVYDREEKRFVHAYAYRDWVIHAFNRDLPYDQFLLQQIAGDQCPEAALGTAPAESPLAAMGFLTLGRRFLGITHDIIDDRIDVVMRGTQALTVGCARCHDHKFDPIPTKDYYSLYGVFNGSMEQMARLVAPPATTPEHAAYEKELQARVEKSDHTFTANRERLADSFRAHVAEYLIAARNADKLPSEEFYTIMTADDLNPVIARQWQAHIAQTRATFDPIFAPWHTLAGLAEQDFPTQATPLLATFATNAPARPDVNPLVLRALLATPPASMLEVAGRYGQVFAAVDQNWRAALQAAATNHTAAPAALDNDQEVIRQVIYGPNSPAQAPPGSITELEYFFDEKGREEIAKAQAEIDRWIIQSPAAPPHAVYLADRPTQHNPHVFKRGNPANGGPEVPRQFLEILAGPARQPFATGSGRLELARAIASTHNPLTARVLVNRVWQHHFGAGLVRTPSDFGTRCEPPSHPELLDWLACRFMDDGWSIKKLHRLLLLSAVYQQSSGRSAAGAATELDPENRWLGRMNRQRLDFEAMRDSLLAVSGQLDERAGGKPVELFGAAPSSRRTVYGQLDRQFVPGVLRVFDFANPDMHSPQRSDTTVPQQALFFMNNSFVVEQARALAHRPEVATAKSPAQRIRQLYHLAYQREPTASQLAAGEHFLKEAGTLPPPEPPAPVVSAWQYGFGEFDTNAQRVTRFTPLPQFTNDAWQGGAAWPDARLGWVQLKADGGHAGNDLQHATIRRWVAPRAGALSITGTVAHAHGEGDGIRARVVSSRAGPLGAWTLHNQKQKVELPAVSVQRGDTVDFVVDCNANLNHDDFTWAPVLTLAGDALTNGAGDAMTEWSAQKDFSGPPPTPPAPLTEWEQYAQALLLANEFMFVD